jgi:hypothetical protein
MRPKIVILTLVLAFGLLGVIAVLKGVTGKHAEDSTPAAAGTQTSQDAGPGATNVPLTTTRPNSGTPPVVSEQVREALIEKALDQVRQLKDEADGTNNPIIIAALLEKMNDPEIEVRKGVVEAFRELNDTNAVPGLLKVVDNLKDPREKVAVLDAIDYIKAPDILAGVNPDDYTNKWVVSTNMAKPRTKAGLLPGSRNQRSAGNNSGQAQPPPAAAPATQPQ